nr:hypothetical protein [uncultured Flavobacterium sp.]
MELDYEKLKGIQEKLNNAALKEIYKDLSDSFLNFTNSDIINYCFHEIKVGTKNQQSARVLNSWINSEIICVKEQDKGKIRRFDRLESIWLNLVVEARKFGVPLESLKQTRKRLMNSPIKDFSLLKFSILDSILGNQKVLMILESGDTNIMSLNTYTKFLTTKRVSFPTHILFTLQDLIAIEFPNNAFEFDFKIKDMYESAEKLTLLYFLRTGDYKSIKLYLEDGDVRLIENSTLLIENKKLLDIISSLSFQKAEIVLNDDVTVTITQ